MSNFYVQSPNEQLLYEFAWVNTIPASTSISASDWTIAPSGPTLSGDGIVSFTTYIQLSNVVVGNRYTLTNKITLSNGEVYEVSAFIYAEKK